MYAFTISINMPPSTTNFLNIVLNQGQAVVVMRWYTWNILGFLSYCGGISVISFVVLAVLLSGYQQFVQNTSMIKRLYGELSDEGDEDREEQTFTKSKELFEDRIERHK